jgi:hypothetical protein
MISLLSRGDRRNHVAARTFEHGWRVGFRDSGQPLIVG